MPDPRMICKVCLRPASRLRTAMSLDPTEGEGPDDARWQFVGGNVELVGWVHVDRPSDEMHEVIPIPADEAPFVDQVCDFCSAPDIAWVFPTEPTRRQWGSIQIEDTAWAACQGCHDDVIAVGADPAALVGRVMARRDMSDTSIPEPMRSILRDKWAELYRPFLENRHDPITLSEWVGDHPSHSQNPSHSRGE